MPSSFTLLAITASLLAISPRTQDAAAPDSPAAERWIVHFASRDFDLRAFRAEMHGQRRPHVVDEIVRDLEAKMRAHQKDFCTDVESLGGAVTHQWWLINGCALEIAPKHVDTIRTMPNVARLEPDVDAFPQIKSATNSSNHNSDKLNASGVTGLGVACAILDTGQDSNRGTSGKPHVTYSKRGSSTTTRLLANLQFGLMPADDVHGHGTGVASIAAGWKWNTARADNGHAPDANVIGYAVANTVSGTSSMSVIASAYQRAAADAARFKIVATNLSYSGSSDVTNAAPLAQDSAALNADLFNATAAGNFGSDLSRSLPNLNGLSVGAAFPNTHGVASWSSRGVQSGRLFPNLCANGVWVDMAARDNESIDFNGSGTSMASPQVCGAATLLRGAFKTLNANETRAILLAATEKNPGAGTGLNSTGTGAGYLRDDIAHDVASRTGQHGRNTLTNASKIWRQDVDVKTGRALQVAIAWSRLDVSANGRTWSNLDLAIKRGTTVLASSRTAQNTVEFVRYVPTATERLTMEVTLVGSVIGGAAQPFGWALHLDDKVRATFGAYGSGCAGSGLLESGGPVVPAGRATRWGSSATKMPFGETNVRFMQAHDSGDFAGTTRIHGLAFRNRPTVRQNAYSLNVTIRVGHTKRPARTLDLIFDNNWDGTPFTAFTGNLKIPVFPAQFRPDVFTLKIPFRTPFTYSKTRGNFLWECVNSTVSQPAANFYDTATSSSTAASRLFATSNVATSGSLNTGSGLVTQLLGPGRTGALVQLGHTGLPAANSPFQVTLQGAAPSSVAILWLGTRRFGIPLGAIAPGCSLYTSFDVLPGGLGTGIDGRGALDLTMPQSLVSTTFYSQWIVLDARANALGLTLSNGGIGLIGD